MARNWLVIIVAAGIWIFGTPLAVAGETSPASEPGAATPTTATDAAPAASAPSMPSPTSAPMNAPTGPAVGAPTMTVPTMTAPSSEPSANEATGGVPMVAASTQEAAAARWGVGARFRVTSVPNWLLGLFLKESHPLTSYAAGLEFFRRSGSFDLVLGVGYQPLSPADGNWLGKGQDASTQTDYLQFRGLGAVTFDAAFIMHTDFNDVVGIHYGGGIGLGVIKGRLLRTSNGTPGCATAPGDTTRCYPVACPSGPCTEAQLVNTEGGTDSPNTPSRFSDNHVPTAYPIVNLVTGLDVRVPNLPGFALKLDFGFFFPTFFGGLSAAYQI